MSVNDELQAGRATGGALGRGLPGRHSIQKALHLGVGNVLRDERGLATHTQPLSGSNHSR